MKRKVKKYAYLDNEKEVTEQEKLQREEHKKNWRTMIKSLNINGEKQRQKWKK